MFIKKKGTPTHYGIPERKTAKKRKGFQPSQELNPDSIAGAGQWPPNVFVVAIHLSQAGKPIICSSFSLNHHDNILSPLPLFSLTADCGLSAISSDSTQTAHCSYTSAASGFRVRDAFPLHP